MKRPAPYDDANANRHSASQMQHMSAQRMQHNAQMNSFPGRPGSLSAEQVHPHISSRNILNPVSANLYSEGKGGNAAQPIYQGRVPDAKADSHKQADSETRLQLHEEDMEIGYEDKPSPLTFEGLEQKFQDEIMKLLKEQSDAEDAENARHREEIIKINTQYLEKLSSLRAQQANRREELLRKESQVRLHQYQQALMEHHLIKTSQNDPHSYGGAAAAEARRTYGTGQYNSYRERPPFLADGRSQGNEGRVPYPEGRVYNNNAGARYY